MLIRATCAMKFCWESCTRTSSAGATDTPHDHEAQDTPGAEIESQAVRPQTIAPIHQAPAPVRQSDTCAAAQPLLFAFQPAAVSPPRPAIVARRRNEAQMELMFTESEASAEALAFPSLAAA